MISKNFLKKSLDKSYEKLYDINSKTWHLLTGDKNKIYNLARKSYFAEEELGLNKSSNEFLHTEMVFLIDKNTYIEDNKKIWKSFYKPEHL